MIWLQRDEAAGWIVGDEGGEFARAGDDEALRYVRDLMTCGTGGGEEWRLARLTIRTRPPLVLPDWSEDG